MKTIKIGGVPEYFNLPILLAIENNEFQKIGVDLVWRDVPEGTGAMSQYLASKELDLAVILTEGIVKSIIEGNPSKIIRSYVESPLIWGVHVPASETVTDISALEGKRFAISRYGSGSNLMAVLMAQNLGWDTGNLKFEVVNNLNGAREAFKQKRADIFLWEKYTTQPLVDHGEFKRIHHYPTPWPCFVIASNNYAYQQYSKEIENLLKIIFFYCKKMKADESSVQQIMERYSLKTDMVIESLAALEYADNSKIKEKTINHIFISLNSVGAVKKIATPLKDVFLP